MWEVLLQNFSDNTSMGLSGVVQLKGRRRMKNKEILLVPGPTPVVDEIYEALASETRGHTDPRFAAIYKRSIENTKSCSTRMGKCLL